MTQKSLLRLTLFLILFSFTGNLTAQIAHFNRVKWKREKIAPGLIWKSSHTLINDSIPQNINVLIVNLHKRNISLAYDPIKNVVLSKQASEAKAIAAINAGFFNIKDGGSASYIKTGGLVVDTDTAKKWKRNSNLNGSILIHKNNRICIGYDQRNNWYDNHPEFKDVLVTGPLLLFDGKEVPLPSSSLVKTKHPRTSIGKKGNHKIVFVTLDGRADLSRGMSLDELTDLMLSLRCKDAVNLDGGGSTTMWISGKPFNGVVNMPSDNKKFDHEGERKVSDILIIK